MAQHLSLEGVPAKKAALVKKEGENAQMQLQGAITETMKCDNKGVNGREVSRTVLLLSVVKRLF